MDGKVLLAHAYKCIYTVICIYKQIRKENNMKEQDFMEQLLNPFATEAARLPNNRIGTAFSN